MYKIYKIYKLFNLSHVNVFRIIAAPGENFLKSVGQDDSQTFETSMLSWEQAKKSLCSQSRWIVTSLMYTLSSYN